MKKNFFAEKELSLSFINNICYVAPGTGKAVHNDRRYHGLVYYPSGGSLFRFDEFGDIRCTAGSVLYLPKGSCYRVEKEGEPAGCYAINFNILEEINETPCLVTLKNTTKVESLFVFAEKHWSSQNIVEKYKCSAAFYEILSVIASESENEYIPNSKKEKLLPALELIRQSFHEREITVKELAELSGMSEVYFRKLFVQVLGTSPVKYINNLKIDRAKELIMSDMYSMKEIATLSGFNDDCYFRRVFRQETSMSPREYRKTKK